MGTTQTLLELLEHSGNKVEIYDIGRRIGRLPRAQFVEFERARAPYPLPMQRKAWVALVQHNRASDAEPVIWFLRLDLDEQGLLVQASRDYLLTRLLESAHAKSSGNDPQAFLQDNPFAFTPKAERMALFHARLSADIGRAPSRFYAHAVDYFQGKLGWDQWEFVGYQGIADVACRHDGEPLTAAIRQLPFAPLQVLCHCLESQRPAAGLTEALLDRLDQTLAQADDRPTLIAALIRALSSRTDDDRVLQRLGAVLADHRNNHIEVLAAISGRAWPALRQGQLLQRYLDCLASPQHPEGTFGACIDDLLSLPDMANAVRKTLRDPTQSDAVRAAFGRMLTAR